MTRSGIFIRATSSLPDTSNLAQHDAVAALVEREAETLERRTPPTELSARPGREVERLAEEQRLRNRRAGIRLPLQALEDDALVGSVLIEEEDLGVRRGHDERVLHLAEHASERRGVGRR